MIIKKIGLIFNTIKYLKAKQLFYQLYYRFVATDKISISAKTKPLIHPFSFPHSAFNTSVNVISNQFTFLHVTHEFANRVDWNYMQHGRLWNYNLQYFDFLNGGVISDQQKQHLLLDIGEWLRDGRLKLEPYPVSVRVMNTIRFLSVTNLQDDRINNILYAQIHYLNNHPEYHLLGNHLLENGFALIMGGFFFGQSRWQEKGRRIIYEQLEEQIMADGAHFELSPMYHQLILFRLLELLDWYSILEHSDTAFVQFLQLKAYTMLQWLKNITFSNGDIPHLNDSTGGIARQTKELLELSCRLGIIKEDPPVPLGASGYRKFNFPHFECVIDVGELGASYQPGHGHSDALSFILYKSAKPLLVEAGTSTYEKQPRRSYERSSAAHNTVTIGGENQSQVWGNFRAARRARVKIIEESPLHCVAMHDGYYRKYSANHTRTFKFQNNGIDIEDDIDGLEGQLHLHFHPECTVVLSDQKSITADSTTFIFFKHAIEVRLIEYAFATGFNKYLPAKKAEVSFKGTLKTSIYFS